MYFAHQIALVLAAVAFANSQSIAGIPSCATAGAQQAFTATGCSTTDYSCVCKSADFASAFDTAAKSGCSAADYATAITAARSLCAQAGVSIYDDPTSSSMMTDTASSMAMTSSTMMASSSTMASTTDTMSMSSAMTSPALSYSVITRCSEETITMTPTAAGTVATFTGAAVRLDGEGVVAFGLMAAVGVVAML